MISPLALKRVAVDSDIDVALDSPPLMNGDAGDLHNHVDSAMPRC